jgi:hypothetical protein
LLAAAVACSVGGGAAMAAGTANVTLHLNSSSVIRSISKPNMGAGFDFAGDYMRNIFSTNPVYTPQGNVYTDNTYAALTRLNFGMYRFPSGTSAELYYWNAPCRSYQDPNGYQLNPAQFLTTDEVLESFTQRSSTKSTDRAAVNAEILWQVNTNFSIDGDKASDCSWKATDGFVYYRTATVKDAGGHEQLNNVGPNGGFTDSGLDYVARSAGDLVRANRKRIGAQQIRYWEIGNEDWSRLTAEQYAQIFVKVALQMKAADLEKPVAGKPLTLIAQTTDSGSWVSKFAAEVKRFGALAENQLPGGVKVGLADVYGLSLHTYETGNQDPSVQKRVQIMSAKTDGSGDIKNTLKDIYSVKSTYGLAKRWRLWVTEYNACEYCGQDSEGTFPIQTLAHGLVNVDRAASMLAMKDGSDTTVDRIHFHSLDPSPKFALLNWNNNGGTYTAPRIMTSGLLMQKWNTLFNGTMYITTIDGSSGGFVPSYTVSGAVAPNDKFAGLTSYAAVDASNTKLNVLLVNRDLYSPTDVVLATPLISLKFNTSGKFSTSTLSGSLLATNIGTGPLDPLQVNFVDQSNLPVASTIKVKVPAGGVMFVSIPVK